jgi:hypothetical protein
MTSMNALSIHFEGYWQCRQATDPDPSRDRRGASGYTFAVGKENDFDQIIRLQKDEIPPGDIRPSYPPHYPPHHPTGSFGVFVTDVRYRGERYNPGYDALYKGKVRWLPGQEGGARGGPRFELRNTITYFPGDGIYMPIVPFHILIESDDKTLAIGRDDPLNPAEPTKQIWQMSDHTEYARRCPVNWFDTSDEVMEAIGVDGPNGLNAFFQRRKEWLQLQLDQENDSVLREAYKNRLYVIRFFSSQKADGRRLETRLSAKALWDFLLHGKPSVRGEERLNGKVDTAKPWHVNFWMGGFDGDLMRGYMRGALDVPFSPFG